MQNNLFDYRPIDYKRVEGKTTQERFDSFDALNPHVYQALVRMALKMRRTGRKHYGMRALLEVLRWQWAIQTQGEDLKLNNNYTPYYARKLMQNNPELAGFFKLRQINR